jgi:hypothetical protein
MGQLAYLVGVVLGYTPQLVELNRRLTACEITAHRWAWNLHKLGKGATAELDERLARILGEIVDRLSPEQTEDAMD